MVICVKFVKIIIIHLLKNQFSLSQFTTEDDCKNNEGTWTNACTVYCNSSETCNNLGI